MVFNENSDFSQNNSIFNDPELQQGGYPQIEQTPPKSSGLLNMFNTFVDKFIEEPKKRKELKSLQKKADELLSEHEEVLKIFYSFGCNLYVNDGFIDIEYPPLNLKGRITLQNNTAEFDETTNKIMEHLAKLVNETNNFGQFMDKYEEEKYYPVGELERTKVLLNKTETEVLCGVMMNKNGETKQVYFYKGKEVQPDNSSD